MASPISPGPLAHRRGRSAVWQRGFSVYKETMPGYCLFPVCRKNGIRQKSHGIFAERGTIL